MTKRRRPQRRAKHLPIARQQQSPSPSAQASPGTQQPHITGSLFAQISVQSSYLPPELFRQYDDVIPGFSERYVQMVETEGQFQRMMAEREMNHKYRIQRYGLLAVYGLCTTAFVVAGYMASVHEPWPGGFIGTAGLVGLTSSILYSTRIGKDERMERARLMTGESQQNQRHA